MRHGKRSRCFLGGSIGDAQGDSPKRRSNPPERPGVPPGAQSGGLHIMPQLLQPQVSPAAQSGGLRIMPQLLQTQVPPGAQPGRLRRKLADSGGLTLVEMLCATLILTLLCVMLSTGLAMAAYDYRMLTAEAEAELLLNTIVSSLTDRLRDSTLIVKVDEDGNKEYSHSLGKAAIAGGSAEAGKTQPAQGTVVLETDAGGLTEQKALLPDGAYGAVTGEDASEGKKRRYEVVSLSVSLEDASGAESVLPPAAEATYPAPGDAVTYRIHITVKDRVTGVSKSTPDDGIAVRCLNPVKKIK